jgi:hypothetical protein
MSYRLFAVLALAGVILLGQLGCGGDTANPKVTDKPPPTLEKKIPAGGGAPRPS